jgi:mRNA-degrading endonuclease RelE of RelBE toxin-antitoxin system
MDTQRYQLVYDIEFVSQIKMIERKHHSFIRQTIEEQLAYTPDLQTRNRQPLDPPAMFGARWELRFGDHNEYRVFYSVYPENRRVHILAIGLKVRDRLLIGGKEVKL